jgi:hypothetical protein
MKVCRNSQITLIHNALKGTYQRTGSAVLTLDSSVSLSQSLGMSPFTALIWTRVQQTDLVAFFSSNTPEMPFEFRSFSFIPSFFHYEMTISFHKVKGNAYLEQLWCCWNNEAVRKRFQTNFSHFGVRVMQGAGTDRPLSVKDSGKAIPRSLPIIYITNFMDDITMW